MSCNCEVCQDIAEFRRQIEFIPEANRDYWHGLYDRVLEVEQDLDWHSAVADGSWPNAVVILEGWLAKAKGVVHEN